jgi:hypothetical protein
MRKISVVRKTRNVKWSELANQLCIACQEKTKIILSECHTSKGLARCITLIVYIVCQIQLLILLSQLFSSMLHYIS